MSRYSVKILAWWNAQTLRAKFYYEVAFVIGIWVLSSIFPKLGEGLFLFSWGRN